MESLEIENPFAQKIPIECFQMPEIKNDPMSFWNRPLIQGVGTDNVENLIRSNPSLGQPLKQLVGNFDFPLRDEHLCLQSRLLTLSSRGALPIQISAQLSSPARSVYLPAPALSGGLRSLGSLALPSGKMRPNLRCPSAQLGTLILWQSRILAKSLENEQDTGR
jgi:hypothetical protein